jgi:excisionase family DNA binding protein
MSPSDATETADPVLTTRAAAHLLGVAVSTAQLWIESGALGAWKTPGGHRRVRLSAVTGLLDRRATRVPRAQAAPSPADPARLAALRMTNLVDTPPEDVFDRITWLATQVTDCPMAPVSLLTSSRQWFKSRVELAAIASDEIKRRR